MATTGNAVTAQNSSVAHAAVLVSNGGSAPAIRSTSTKGYGAELEAVERHCD